MTDIGELPPRGRVLVDSAPVIYLLEGPRELAPRYAPFLERAEADDYDLIVTTSPNTAPLSTGQSSVIAARR